MQSPTLRRYPPTLRPRFRRAVVPKSPTVLLRHQRLRLYRNKGRTAHTTPHSGRGQNLASPKEVGNLVAAGERIEERINVVAALTARRDSIRNQPGRRAEAEAIGVAIAKRLGTK